MRTRVGYTGGTTRSPTYHDLANHTEAVQVDFDPSVLTYEALMEMVWSLGDPTQKAWSDQYKSAVWTHSAAQQTIAVRTGERAAERRRGQLRVLVEPAATFWRAEDYHQKFRLRQHDELTAELIARHGSDQAMVDATEAARLNAFLYGHGERARDEDYVRGLSLSAANEASVLAALR